MPLEIAIITLRFALVFVLSTLFGLERQRSHKPVSFGTFVFVAMGSCALAVAASLLNLENPLPLLAAIVTGIGFLGAGALIKTSDKIFGFTTAAAIWTFAIFGLIIGIGQYFPAGILYLSIWLVILIDNYFERHGIGLYQKKLIITTRYLIDEREIKKALSQKTENFKLISSELDRKNKKLIMGYLIECTKEEINEVPLLLSKKPWLESCRID